MHLAHALLAQNRAEEASSVLFSAFGSEAYYQQADYRNAAIQALRLCPDSVKHHDVNQYLGCVQASTTKRSLRHFWPRK